MSTLKERIEELMRVTGMNERAVADAAGVSLSAVIQWLGRGGENSKEIKSLGVRPACRLEDKSGLRALWLATGEGEKMVSSERMPPPAWPFEDVSQAEYDMLTVSQRGSAQGAMQNEIDRILARKGLKSNGAGT